MMVAIEPSATVLLLDDESMTPPPRPRFPCANLSNPGCRTEKFPCCLGAVGIPFSFELLFLSFSRQPCYCRTCLDLEDPNRIGVV